MNAKPGCPTCGSLPVAIARETERADRAEAEARHLRTALTYLLDGRSDLPDWAAGTVEDVLRPRTTSAKPDKSTETP